MKISELPANYKNVAIFEWKKQNPSGVKPPENLMYAFSWNLTEDPNFWAKVCNVSTVEGLPPLPNKYKSFKKVTYGINI